MMLIFLDELFSATMSFFQLISIVPFFKYNFIRKNFNFNTKTCSFKYYLISIISSENLSDSISLTMNLYYTIFVYFFSFCYIFNIILIFIKIFFCLMFLKVLLTSYLYINTISKYFYLTDIFTRLIVYK